MCNVTTNKIKKQVIFVFIKKLIKNFIFGIDALNIFHIEILTYKRVITIFDFEINYGLKELKENDRTLINELMA